ncbi:MAG: DegT/DnrJ/EryC1/StrS aminotransferase family protein [Candidatus Thermoplasmatota archaeon]|nr:DegT/DnrJ/EryC1/StrS aminotransferase family protein [Candidatus Thermoplasmatota archaeon]
MEGTFGQSAFRDSALKCFEKRVAAYAGTRNAILCSSGRTAILFSLLALDTKPGNRVIIPDYSCQILPIAVFCTGGIANFCDMDKKTLGLSYGHLEKLIQSDTKAVILVHPYGIPVDPSPVLELTQDNDVFLISDAAQAITARIHGKNVASFGDVGIFSFNKFLNVNLGAVVVTNNDEIAEKIELIRNQFEVNSYAALIGNKCPAPKVKKIKMKMFSSINYLHRFLLSFSERKHFSVVNGWVNIDEYLWNKYQNNTLTRPLIGHLMAYNTLDKYSAMRKMEESEVLDLDLKFSDIQKLHEKRTMIGKRYEQFLKEDVASKFSLSTDATPSFFRYPVLFSDENIRNSCIDNLSKAGYLVNYLYKPLHKSPLFRYENVDATFGNSVCLSKHLLPLPINPHLSLDDVDNIIEIVNLA